MAKKKAKPKKPGQRITTKQVQAAENLPVVLPQVTVKPEHDEDGWGGDGLTEKQRRFVRFYIHEAAGNATKAARMAGYSDNNEIALRSTASENLTKPNVQRAIERERGKLFGSPDDVKASISAIANGNAADYLRAGADGEMHLDLKAMAEAGALGLLQQVQEERLDVGGAATTVKIKLKLYDRLRALELLAKMNGQLVDRSEVKVSGEIEHKQRVQLAMGRLMESPEAFDMAKRLAERMGDAPAVNGNGINGNGTGHS